MTDRKSLVEAIARAEARLAQLDNVKNKIAEELANLRDELASLSENEVIKEPPLPFGSSVTKDSPPEKKMRLFRSLFRGREDVYPRYWQSKKTGKKGYSPACKNDRKVKAKYVAGLTVQLPIAAMEVRIHDYVDQNVPMLMRMYEKRLKGYRGMGYRLVSFTGPSGLQGV